MAKELSKLKEDIRKDLSEMKNDLQQELKTIRDSIERNLRNEIRELRGEVSEVTKSIEYAHDDIKELKEKLENEITRNTALAKENEALRAKCTGLERSTAELEKRLTLVEQYSRNANIEIQGVVEVQGENVKDLMTKIGSAIQEQILESDIEACHRVPTRHPGKSNIVVRFKSRAKRDETLRKAKKKRITNSNLGLESTAPIYINEHLTPSNKRLLGAAIAKKKQVSWKHVWTKNGVVLARKTDGSDIVQIHCNDDLIKMT